MHKLFARQLAKATTPTGEVDIEALRQLVVSAYEHLDRDRRRTDRSIALMVKELDERLREQARWSELVNIQKLQLDTALNNMSQGLCMFDAEGRIVLCNDRYAAMMGLSVSSLKDLSLLDLLIKYRKSVGADASDAEKVFTSVLADAREGKPSTKIMDTSAGRTLRVSDRPMANGGWVSTFEDITEQRKQEESFRLLFENNALPMLVFDTESLRFLAVNDAALHQYGYSRDEFLKLNALDIRPPDHRADFIDKVKTLDEYQFGAKWTHRRADGSLFIASVYSRQLSYDGLPARLVVVVDVTERVRAEEERDHSRELLDRVLDNVTVTILVKDARTLRYVLANRAAEKLWGYPREKMIGKRPHEVFDQKTADIIEANDRKLLESNSNYYIPDHEVRTPHNGVRTVTTNRIAIRNPAGEVQYVLSVVDDVTERHRVEDQLRQAQKMEAVGKLTGGVAHDFNNLLTVIMGNLDLLREELADSASAVEKIDTILEAAERGADLTRHMLAFSRRQPLQAKMVDVNSLVANTNRLLGPTLGENISIVIQTTKDMPAAFVDAAQLETALLNIAINARDAMPNGGTLTISTRLANLDADGAAAPAGVTADGYVAIEITDSGTGMPADVLERIFEPFFTTKQPGQGTGLGLSMVYGFVKQSGGHIKAYSELGRGTTFVLFLPLASSAQPPPVTEAAKPFLGERTGSETILAVEDNPDIRSTVVRQLRDLGYRMQEAEDAETAVRILDTPEPIHLLLTDMILPGGLNGKELATRACAKRPDLKVLFTSGFPGTSDRHGTRLEPGDVLLSKPYRKDDLARAVADMLRSAAPARGAGSK